MGNEDFDVLKLFKRICSDFAGKDESKGASTWKDFGRKSSGHVARAFESPTAKEVISKMEKHLDERGKFMMKYMRDQKSNYGNREMQGIESLDTLLRTARFQREARSDDVRLLKILPQRTDGST